MANMVVIADDLTGAADCAASSAALGGTAVVLLHSPEGRESEADWPDADILSIDANSRHLSPQEASKLTARLVRLCDSHNADRPGYVLYKKIDSTLRGNVAGEVAALLHIRRTTNPAAAKLSVLMAPALPAQGRTTIDGRLLVHGVPLEQTDIWKNKAAAQSDIFKLLDHAGLSCGLVDTSTVRSGLSRLRQAVLQTAEQMDVVVCDAETDEDLGAIAEASLGEPTITAWVGSAGLASQISKTIGIVADVKSPVIEFAAGPTLFVVGSAASVSRQQALSLETNTDIAAFHVTPDVLQNPSIMQTQITQFLQSGRDVLLVMDGDEIGSRYEAPFFSQALTGLVSNCGRLIGKLVATGGETARAVLDALQVKQLRLIGEVEAGLPFSVAACWERPLPVITKAGAFGSSHAFIRCREFLRELECVPGCRHATSRLLHHES